jgi:16S rRNA G966 N2-methylase RsmD
MPVERYIKFSSAGPFDFIFLDPPFPYTFRRQLLEMIAESSLLARDAAVLIHYPKDDPLPREIASLVQKDLRCYGRSLVGFYGRAEKP